MTDFDVDPFDDIEEAPVKKAAPKKAAKPTITQDEDGSFRLGITIKGGSGFDVPWLTPAYPSWQAAAADLEDPEVEKAILTVIDRTAKINAYFQKKVAEYAPEKPAAAAPSRSAPAGAVEPPAGTPAAPGPDWTYKTGVGKTGKPWKGWFPPRGSSEQPVWL